MLLFLALSIKRAKSWSRGRCKNHPLGPQGCPQRCPGPKLISISAKAPKPPAAFVPANFQSARGMVIPLKQQHFPRLEWQVPTQDGLPSKMWAGKPRGPGEPDVYIGPEAACRFPLSASVVRHPIMSCPFADCTLLVFIWQPRLTLPFNLSIIHSD